MSRVTTPATGVGARLWAKRSTLSMWVAAAVATSACGPGPGGQHVENCEDVGVCRGAHCVADRGVPPDDLKPVPLHCADLGPGGLPEAPCRTADDCAHGVCTLSFACAAPCTDDSDCDEDFRCISMYARTSETTLQPLHGCARFSSLPHARTADAVRISGVSTGEDVWLPGTTGALAEFVVWPKSSSPLSVRTLRTRDDPEKSLFDLAAALDVRATPPPLTPINPVQAVYPPVMVLLPNGSNRVFSAAGYALGVTATAESTADLFLFGDSDPADQGRIDLNVFYAGATGIDPIEDHGADELERALASVRSILGSAGLSLGEVRHIPLVGALESRFAFLSLDDEQRVVDLDLLFQLSAGTVSAGVNVFLIRSMDGVLGLTGGIPGPPGMHGSGASGIAIALDWVRLRDQSQPNALGPILAHEVGHYLGLFHTTEINGAVVEPLEDTAECRPESDANGDGVVSASECASKGSDNLMFWEARGTALTPDQATLMRSSPLLR